MDSSPVFTHRYTVPYNDPMKAVTPKLTNTDIERIAKLANLPITKEQANELTEQVGITVEYVSLLKELPTDDVEETSQVTGLENVVRDDIIDTSRMFTQEEVLSNAPRKHNGFFVVDQVLEEK